MFKSVESSAKVALSVLAFSAASYGAMSATPAEAAPSTTPTSGLIVSPPKAEGTAGSSNVVQPEKSLPNYTTNHVPKSVLSIVSSIFNHSHLKSFIDGDEYQTEVTKQLPGHTDVQVTGTFEAERINGKKLAPVLANGRPNEAMLGELLIRVVQPHHNATLVFEGDGQFWSSYGVYGLGRGNNDPRQDTFAYAQKNAIEEWEYSTTPYPTPGRISGAAGVATFGTAKGDSKEYYEGQLSVGTTYANPSSTSSVIKHDTNLFMNRLAAEASYVVNSAANNDGLRQSITPVAMYGIKDAPGVNIPA